MNRHSGFRHLFVIIATLAMAAGSIACGASKQKKADENAAQQRATKQAAKKADEVEEPSDEELAGSPCGNPRWAKLPDGADSAGNEEDDASENAEGDETTDGESPSADDSEDAAKPGDC